MFRREIKKQFNENKYNVLTQKGKTFAQDEPLFRCYAEIPTLKSPIPEVVGRIPCFDCPRLQLHKALLYFPSSS